LTPVFDSHSTQAPVRKKLCILISSLPAASFACEAYAIHGKKLLGPFEGIDKADQLQVIARKIAFNLDWNNSRIGRSSCYTLPA